MSMSDFGGVQNEGFIETRGCLSSTQIAFFTAYQIIESVHELQLRLFTRLFLETISSPSPVTLPWIRRTSRAFGSIEGKGV